MKYILLIVIIFPVNALSCDFIPTEYQTVSESEWNISLLFQEGGKVTILNETWEPGNYENRTQNKLHTTWVCESNVVSIQTESVIETFVYSAATNLKEIGRPELFAPGLVGSCREELCKYNRHHFWEREALKKTWQ